MRLCKTPALLCCTLLSTHERFSRFKIVATRASALSLPPVGNRLGERCDSDHEQLTSEPLVPPLVPRRTLAFASAAALTLAASSVHPQAVPHSVDWSGTTDDSIKLPPLSLADKIVAFFRRHVHATERERAPRTRRRLIAPAYAAECDAECKQRIADRRALFEQSRTTSDRQKILDLSRQRAALYNTSFQGASCIAGLPCL